MAYQGKGTSSILIKCVYLATREQPKSTKSTQKGTTEIATEKRSQKIQKQMNTVKI